ncbi:hypothetical protein ATCC90586_011173 [Pythium insidiosum]|nr:hypothetical protein ATCC90586_011173 [Pythium insidiosum]
MMAPAPPAVGVESRPRLRSESNSTAKRDVYLTGFGKFQGVPVNPTSVMVQQLTSNPFVTEAKVLETSAVGSLEMVAPLRAKAEASGRPAIFLHLGVSPESRQFALERVAYNLANFMGMPDERGYVAVNQVLDQNAAASIRTTIPVDVLLGRLRQANPNARASTDPGRFICNFIYFHSLQWAQKMEGSNSSQIQIFFIHTPMFREMKMETQLEFLRTAIELLATM